MSNLNSLINYNDFFKNILEDSLMIIHTFLPINIEHEEILNKARYMIDETLSLMNEDPYAVQYLIGSDNIGTVDVPIYSDVVQDGERITEIISNNKDYAFSIYASMLNSMRTESPIEILNGVVINDDSIILHDNYAMTMIDEYVKFITEECTTWYVVTDNNDVICSPNEYLIRRYIDSLLFVDERDLIKYVYEDMPYDTIIGIMSEEWRINANTVTLLDIPYNDLSDSCVMTMNDIRFYNSELLGTPIKKLNILNFLMLYIAPFKDINLINAVSEMYCLIQNIYIPLEILVSICKDNWSNIRGSVDILRLTDLPVKYIVCADPSSAYNFIDIGRQLTFLSTNKLLSNTRIDNPPSLKQSQF